MPILSIPSFSKPFWQPHRNTRGKEIDGRNLILEQVDMEASVCRYSMEPKYPGLVRTERNPHLHDLKDVEVLLVVVRQHGPRWEL